MDFGAEVPRQGGAGTHRRGEREGLAVRLHAFLFEPAAGSHVDLGFVLVEDFCNLLRRKTGYWTSADSVRKCANIAFRYFLSCRPPRGSETLTYAFDDHFAELHASHCGGGLSLSEELVRQIDRRSHKCGFTSLRVLITRGPRIYRDP